MSTKKLNSLIKNKAMCLERLDSIKKEIKIIRKYMKEIMHLKQK